MRQKISSQMGSRYQGRPGRGERREACGIAGQYRPGAIGGGDGDVYAHADAFSWSKVDISSVSYLERI